MARNCRIVEFAGLAGCGKTTLAKSLKEYFENRKYSVITLDEIDGKFKHKNLLKLLFCINPIELISIIKLFSTVKYNKNRLKSMYSMQVKLYIFYKFCRKYSDYDYVFIDHGMIQNFVSFMFNSDSEIKDNKKYLKMIYKMFSFIYPDLIIRCIIDAKNANERMKIRGREVATIEKEKSDFNRLVMINKDKRNFNELFDYCKKNIDIKICELNMSGNKNEVLKSAIDILDMEFK